MRRRQRRLLPGGLKIITPLNDGNRQKIIDFAIEREREAVRFYRQLESNPGFSGKKRLLRDLEAMEEGHIRILEDLRARPSREESVYGAQDLHMSEYLVPPPEEGAKSFQDILVLAMKKEETAYRLYTDLAGKQKEENTRETFLRLASEEARHKRYFEEMYDEEILTQG